MKFTNEQLEKAKQAKTAEELLALAKENGMELTEEEAKNYFEQWHREGALADEELDNVSGGCGNSYDPHTDPSIRTELICYGVGCNYWVIWQGKWEANEKFDCPKCGRPNSVSAWKYYYD